MDDAQAGSRLSCTSSSSASVRVAFDVLRQTIVDDVCEVGHIESSGSHVGSHEQLDVVLAEFRHGQVALSLTQFAMQTVGIVTIVNEFVGNFLRFETGTAEDDGINLWIEVCQSLQRIVFVLCLHQIVDVVDEFSTFISASHHDFLGIVEVVLADALDFLAHRGREQQRVALGRHFLKNGINALRESHRQHFVGFVEHHVFHLVQLCHATLHQINESSWCGNNHLYTFLQGANLRFDVGTAIHRQHVQTVNVFGIRLEVVRDL